MEMLELVLFVNVSLETHPLLFDPARDRGAHPLVFLVQTLNDHQKGRNNPKQDLHLELLATAENGGKEIQD